MAFLNILGCLQPTHAKIIQEDGVKVWIFKLEALIFQHIQLKPSLKTRGRASRESCKIIIFSVPYLKYEFSPNSTTDGAAGRRILSLLSVNKTLFCHRFEYTNYLFKEQQRQQHFQKYTVLQHLLHLKSQMIFTEKNPDFWMKSLRNCSHFLFVSTRRAWFLLF